MPVLLVETQSAHTTVLTLNRPERRNALTIELMTELTNAIDAADGDDRQRILILRGAGASFCTGLDLKEVSEAEKAHESAGLVAKTLLAISQTRLITIAAVHGAAIAGGAGIMSACDFVIAAEGTKFGYPEVRRGLVAANVMTFLRRQLRERDIRELLLTGELIESDRALQIGLINRIVPPTDLDAEVRKLCASILQNAPGALAHSKRLLEQLWATSVKEDIEVALGHHMQARESAEAREGVTAFLEKRSPAWVP
ncbi:MAG TPA: enoyl-CoA hydratase-related protein [Chthoniobacterales bacterium]|nr:enoyl-CoA hydratase-related protein [Chthoniobacterales bacterium]